MGIKCKMLRYMERDYVSVIIYISFHCSDIMFQSFFLQRMMQANLGNGFDMTFMLAVFLVCLVSLINSLMSAVIVKSWLSSSLLHFHSKTKKVSQEQERNWMGEKSFEISAKQTLFLPYFLLISSTSNVSLSFSLDFSSVIGCWRESFYAPKE